ncbi:MAG: hypothetical protein PHY02_07595 [Phycisphaerae bacterium]|nr:hypothetical protein [Phycisphaerae bacterium]
MKQLMVLLGFVLLVLGGCQEVSQNKSGTKVTIEDGSEFPQFLAGAWEANKNKLNYWRIIFEGDGTISSAVNPIGMANIRANRKTEVPGPKGEHGFVYAGDFNVSYNPQSRELAVNIKIEQFCLYLFDGGMVKGSWEYLITGEVSDDGKTWTVDLFNSPDIAAFAPDPNSPKDKPIFEEKGKLRVGLGEEEGDRLIFTKVPDANNGPR